LRAFPGLGGMVPEGNGKDKEKWSEFSDHFYLLKINRLLIILSTVLG